MKKIFYICTNPIENWDIYTPEAKSDQSPQAISLLLLHQKQNLEHVTVSQIWHLNETKKANDNLQETLSYQEFLEKIFSHDLSVVI